MKSKIITYLKSISQEPFALSSLDLVDEGKIIQFPHSLQVMLLAIKRNDKQWWGLIQDSKGKSEWALIKDPSWKKILERQKYSEFRPVPVSLLKLERIESKKFQNQEQSSINASQGNLIVHVGIYDNKWFVNASSFGSYLRCPRIIYLKQQGLYQQRSVAAVKGNLIHEFHVSLYQQLSEEYRSNPRALYEIAEQLRDSVTMRSWRDLVSVNLTADEGKRFIDTELFVRQIIEAPEWIPWSSDHVISEFWLSSPTFGMQGFVDRLSLLKNGEIAVFELKSGRQPRLKVKAAKYQAAAYALMLLSLGLKVRTLVIEFPEARPPHEERFMTEELLPHYFDKIPSIRNHIYHLSTSRDYRWPVQPWRSCSKSCFVKPACQFYCYVDNLATNTIKIRCTPSQCQFQDPRRSGDYFCTFPKLLASYPINFELIAEYVKWFKLLLLEEKSVVQEEINEVILPASERERTGNALADMIFVGIVDHSSANVLVFQKMQPIDNPSKGLQSSSNENLEIIPLPPTRMQPGDPVLLTPMDKLPRSPHSFRGRLLHVTTTAVMIEVDSNELNGEFIGWDERLKRFTPTTVFRIDLLPSVTTIQTQLRAMDVMARAAFDKELQVLFPHALKLRNLLTFVQPPRFEPVASEIINSVKSLSLNERQKKAIIQTLRARDFVLIHGPPGSGKTTTICNLMAQILKHQKVKVLGKHVKKLPILVAGFTRKSVDNIVAKWQQEFFSLGKIVRVGLPSSGSESEVQEVSIEYEVIKISSNDNDGNLDVPRKVMEELDSADIIATTAASALSSILERYQFQTVIVDEAGQCTEPLTIVPLLKGERFVLVGDHIQLPPVVTSKRVVPLPSKVADHLQIRTISSVHHQQQESHSSQLEPGSENQTSSSPDTLELSLFSRLFRKYGTNDEITIFLNEQYRMHPLIAGFASTFYSEPIVSPRVQERTLMDWLSRTFGEKTAIIIASHVKDTPWDLERPFIGLDTYHEHWHQDMNIMNESSFNEHEAEYISSLVIDFFRIVLQALLKGIDNRGTPRIHWHDVYHSLLQMVNAIGITTPYRTQVMKIRTKFQQDFTNFIKHDLGYEISEDEMKAIEHALMIETVDRFQGREKEIMIISLVDSNPDGKISELLQDDRRLNVAITRAKRKLIVIGNLTMLSKLPFYRKMMRYLKQNDGYVEMR